MADTPSEVARLREELADLQVRLAARDTELSRWRQQYLIADSLWASVQQSPGWRLTAPLRALRRWLAPRGFDGRALIPWQQLRQLGPDAWRSHGPDPQFFVPCLLPAGWARLQLDLTCAVAGRVQVLADYGDGFRASECLARVDGRGTVALDQLVYLPRPARGVRLDPPNAPGDFRLQRLCVQPLSWYGYFRQAVVARWQRRRGQGGAGPQPSPGPQLRFALERPPRVSIIIPCAGRPTRLPGTNESHLSRCCSSIRQRSSYPNYEIVIVHDGELPDEIQTGGVRTVACGQPFNRAAAWNAGAAEAGGEQLLFLHDDVEVLHADWIEALVEHATQPAVGAVGGQLVLPDGRSVREGDSAVSGACLMTRRELFQSVRGFSEEFGHYADVDYCLKVREAGRRLVATPHAQLRQHAPRGRLGTYAAELEALRAKWQGRTVGEEETILPRGICYTQKNTPAVPA